MTQTLQFDLVSPEAKLISEPVAMVVVPGADGDMGVLAGHSPVVSNVRTGVVEIYRADRTKCDQKIFIAGGFADINGEQCSVLAEQAIDVKDLNKADLEKQISNLEIDLQSISDEHDRARFQKRLDILNMMVQAAA